MIADDHPVVREGLVTILKSEKDIEVVAEAADGKETCELYHELAPDVLLLDLRMPEKDGLQVITDLMARGEPKPRIIVMTTYESEGDVRRVLKAGSQRLPGERGRSAANQGSYSKSCRWPVLAAA